MATLHINRVVDESIGIKNVLHGHSTNCLLIWYLCHLLRLCKNALILLTRNVLEELFGSQDGDATEHPLFFPNKFADLDLWGGPLKLSLLWLFYHNTN